MEKANFKKRTTIVFVSTFLAAVLVCLRYNLPTKLAIFAGFLGAGIWLILVEDILSPAKRERNDE